MKIGILSDTHGDKLQMDKAISYLKKCDLIIHAGDNFSDSKYIYNETKINIIAVKGNCDFEQVEDELLFEVENKNIFLCHGDRYNVSYGIEDISKKAKYIGADIAIFGHTHTPLNINKDGILYINPGSISLPRKVSYKSFVIMHINNTDVSIEEIRI